MAGLVGKPPAKLLTVKVLIYWAQMETILKTSQNVGLQFHCSLFYDTVFISDFTALNTKMAGE
jgi:hypothetical protein